MSYRREKTMVEVIGIEPATVCLQSRCYYQLSYTPEKLVPQVGIEPTRPKALTSEASAATHYATGGN